MNSSAFSLPFDPLRLTLAEQRIVRELEKRAEQRRLENRLIDFVEASWSVIDPSQYQQCWAIDALCEHLEAVTFGHIRKLLINFPPRCGKTNVTSIAWPAWTWARSQQSFVSGPNVRFLCASYNRDLALQNSNKTRRLVASPFYQDRWAKSVIVCADQDAKQQFDLSKGGSRQTTSVGGSLLGLGGDVIIVDDPHNTEGVESDAERETAKTFWSEISSTRLNDPKRSAIVVIMQRLHAEDISGLILEGDDSQDWTHLCLPMRHDPGRHCVTTLAWDDKGTPTQEFEDPRTEDRELMWPDRFGEREVNLLESRLGPYMAAGRLQQSPTTKGGAIFLRDWWQVWEPEGGKYPQFDFLLASVDGAFTEKEENDPSAMTVWGVFTENAPSRYDPKTNQVWQTRSGQRKVMLINAWRKHLKMHMSLYDEQGNSTDPQPGESYSRWRLRTQKHWGLVEWIGETCRYAHFGSSRPRSVDRLIIEAKASGISVVQEMQRLYADDQWTTIAEPVKGDKVSRAHAVVPAWSQGLIYAPDREWADLAITEMESFPKGKYKDLTDSATQAIKYLREVGLIQHPDERLAQELETMKHKRKPEPLYDT